MGIAIWPCLHPRFRFPRDCGHRCPLGGCSAVGSRGADGAPRSPQTTAGAASSWAPRLLPTYLSEKAETAAGGAKRDCCFPPANENEPAHSSLGAPPIAGRPCPCKSLPNSCWPFRPRSHLTPRGPLLFYVNQVQSWKNGLQVRCGCELYLRRKFVVRIKYEQRLDSRHSVPLVCFYYP